MTQRPSLFTPISYYAIVFAFALIFADGWFTACDGFHGASAYWLSHMKQSTITILILRNAAGAPHRGGINHGEVRPT